MPKLIIFDCDGTLREPIHNGRIPDDASFEDTYELLPDVVSKLKTIDWSTTLAGIASNQESVASGLVSKQTALRLLTDTLGEATGVNMPARPWPIAMCPHSPKGGCICRKPSPFMLVYDMLQCTEWGTPLNLSDVLFVGDQPTDKEAARRAGIPFKSADEFFDR